MRFLGEVPNGVSNHYSGSLPSLERVPVCPPPTLDPNLGDRTGASVSWVRDGVSGLG